jgi:hypothetical protein
MNLKIPLIVGLPMVRFEEIAVFLAENRTT